MAAARPARFGAGDMVKVRVGSPPTHFRTPEYIQGKTGVVVIHYGDFRNPESLAHGGEKGVGIANSPVNPVSRRAYCSNCCPRISRRTEI